MRPGYSRLSLFILLFLVRGISLCLLDHLGNLFGYEQKGHFEHPLLWVHSIPWLHLRFWLISFPISKPLFYGRPRCSTVPTSVLVCKKTKSIKSDSFYWECVCILRLQKETTVFLNLFNIYSWYLYPQHLHCQSVLCKSAFFCWSGRPHRTDVVGCIASQNELKKKFQRWAHLRK